MKKLWILVFFLTFTAVFAKKLSQAHLGKIFMDWACCTVSNGTSEVTVCRADGNLKRACNDAIRIINKL